MNKPVGQEQQFKKKLNPMDVWAIAFGCIIGWGAFINPGEKFLPNSGVLGTAIAIAIGAVIMIVISFSYAYMIRKHPKAGGEFIFAKQCFGRIPAYICGWFLIAAYLSNVPLNSTALGLVIDGLAPGALHFGFSYEIAGNTIYLGEILVACGVLILFAVINMLGTKKAGIVQTVLAVLLAVTVIILVVATIASPLTSWDNIGPLWGYFKTPEGYDPKVGVSGIMSAILATLAIAPWAFVGFETIPQAAEEFKFSFKKVIFIMVIAIIFGTFVYVANNTITALVIKNWPEYISNGGRWPLLYAAQQILGEIPGSIILGTAVLSAILSGIMGFYMASSRLIYSMGREGYLPKKFGTVDKKHNVPQLAIIFCLVISLVGPFLGRNALSWFVDMASIGTSIGFGFTCLAAFITMTKDKDGNIFAKILTLLGFAFACLFIVIQLIPIGNLGVSFSVPSYIIFGVWIALGVLFFIWQTIVKKRKEKEEATS
ncbi:MAG: APC family permease [Bacilli bacterium]|nr:APC family permease [Bacilli bacterium]